MDMVKALQIALHNKSSGYKHITIEKNPVRTILATYLIIIDYGNMVNVMFLTEVPYDDLLKYNSQFSSVFSTKYFYAHSVALTEVNDKNLKKILVIRHRKNYINSIDITKFLYLN